MHQNIITDVLSSTKIYLLTNVIGLDSSQWIDIILMYKTETGDCSNDSEKKKRQKHKEINLMINNLSGMLF